MQMACEICADFFETFAGKFSKFLLISYFEFRLQISFLYFSTEGSHKEIFACFSWEKRGSVVEHYGFASIRGVIVEKIQRNV